METQTVKLASEVSLVVTLWRQEDTKWDWIPTDVPTVIYIYTLRHDHLEMVKSRYDKVADKDDVADPLMTMLGTVMSYETPAQVLHEESCNVRWRLDTLMDVPGVGTVGLMIVPSASGSLLEIVP